MPGAQVPGILFLRGFRPGCLCVAASQARFSAPKHTKARR